MNTENKMPYMVVVSFKKEPGIFKEIRIVNGKDIFDEPTNINIMAKILKKFNFPDINKKENELINFLESKNITNFEIRVKPEEYEETEFIYEITKMNKILIFGGNRWKISIGKNVLINGNFIDNTLEKRLNSKTNKEVWYKISSLANLSNADVKKEKIYDYNKTEKNKCLKKKKDLWNYIRKAIEETILNDKYNMKKEEKAKNVVKEIVEQVKKDNTSKNSIIKNNIKINTVQTIPTFFKY